MPTMTASAGSVTVSAEYPAEWYAKERVVPSLVFPRELFTISNRDVPETPPEVEQPRPMMAAMGPDAVVIWCYAQIPSEEPPSSKPVAPDYSRYSTPLDYNEAETYSAYDAREWDGRNFLWRRIGVSERGVWVTLWIWEGTQASEADVAEAHGVVESLAVEAS